MTKMTLTASFLQLGHSILGFKHYEFTPTSLVPSFLTSNHMEYIYIEYIWNHISNLKSLPYLPYHCDLPTILMILEILSLSGPKFQSLWLSAVRGHWSTPLFRFLANDKPSRWESRRKLVTCGQQDAGSEPLVVQNAKDGTGMNCMSTCSVEWKQLGTQHHLWSMTLNQTAWQPNCTLAHRIFHTLFPLSFWSKLISNHLEPILSERKAKDNHIATNSWSTALITAQFLVQKKARGKNASSLSSLGRDGSPKRYRAMLILRRLNQRKVHRRFTERSLKVHRRFTRESLMTFRCTIYKSSFTFDSLPLKSLCLVSSHSLFHFLRPRLYNTDYLEAVRSFCKTLFLWIWP